MLKLVGKEIFTIIPAKFLSKPVVSLADLIKLISSMYGHQAVNYFTGFMRKGG